MWGLAAVFYSVCTWSYSRPKMSGRVSDISQIYFPFLVEGFVLELEIYFSEFLFSVILYQKFIFPHLRYSLWYQSFLFIQYAARFILQFSPVAPLLGQLQEGGVTQNLKIDKLESRSRKGRFMGYLEHCKGYYFYFPSDQRMLISRDAIFLEKEFL